MSAMETAIVTQPEQPAAAKAAAAPATGLPAAAEESRRSAAVPVAAAFAAGIFADHLLEPDLRVWLVAAALCLAAWGVCLARRLARTSAVMLLAAVLVAGAGWHHWRWSIVGADH